MVISKSGSAIPNMTFSTRNFDPLSPLAPNFGIQKQTVPIVTHALVLQNFYTTWVRVLLAKTTFRTKIGGCWTRGAPKKWEPCMYFYNFTPLKLATSNIVHNLGLAYQKQRLGPELAGVWARGASEKNVGLPIYFCNR